MIAPSPKPAEAALPVLVVEDSPADALLLQESLREAVARGEITLRLVRTLAAAQAELRQRCYAGVLLDLGLPDGHGLADVELLRAIDGRLTVVVLTGLDCESSAIRALQLGAQEYVVKGQYDGERLLKVIRHAVERNRQMRELEARQAQQFEQASHDPVTGLLNRTLFEVRARRHLQLEQGLSPHFAICFIDLDRFKAVNDQHGHAIGDALLARVAQILRDSVRDSDIVARIGGDEFAILLSSVADARSAHEVGERIVEQVRNLIEVEDCFVRIGCSLGIALFPDHGTSLEGLLHQADIAMYRAKGAGGGVMVAGDDAQLAPKGMARFLADVRGALAEGHFEVHFQPWADLRQAQFTGVETLLRWRRAEGLQLPHEFLPRLSRSGLLPEMGLEVARMAARECRRWREQGLAPGVLGLNLGADELRAPGQPLRLLRVLAEEKLGPQDVQIEVEAAVLGSDDAAVLEALRRLEEAGFSVVIDGFVPGKAALPALATPGVRGIKLDRAIWRPAALAGPGSPGWRLLVAVLGAATALDLSVYLLGIEGLDDIGAMPGLRIRGLQGHWLCPPMPAADLPDALKAGQRRLASALPVQALRAAAS